MAGAYQYVCGVEREFRNGEGSAIAVGGTAWAWPTFGRMRHRGQYVHLETDRG